MDITDGLITVRYENGKKVDILMTDPEINIEGYDKTKVGKQEVTVEYKNKTTKFNVTILSQGKELYDITIMNGPTKVEYIEGEDFDKTGMMVVARYNDGTSEEITEYIVVDGAKLKVTQENVTISYTENGKTVTTKQNISVSHNFITETIEATCTKKGCTKKKCTVCGEEEIISEIAALGHNYDDVITEPTCTENGYTTHTCTRCNDTYIDDEEAALGHDYENGVCIRCGTREPIIQITSEKYIIDDNHNYIKNVQPKTQVKDLINAITTNATEVKLYKGDKELKDTDIVSTNAKIRLKSGTSERVLTIIVLGDIDKNGKADFWDMIEVNKHRLGIKTLEEIGLLAGDVNVDNKVDFWDLIKINKFRLGILKNL